MTTYERHIPFEGVFNFRDLGGYRTRDGRTVRWRSIFRSGELHELTEGDAIRMRDELSLTTVIDLRNSIELEQSGTGLVTEVSVRYHNLPLSTGGPEARQRILDSSNMGELYMNLLDAPWYGARIVEVLGIIAESENQPVVFHCSVGKDRTGILASVILSLLGVPDETIIEDYALSSQYTEAYINRVNSDPAGAERFKHIPRHVFEAAPESMEAVLTKLRDEYSSVRGYVKAHGGDDALVRRLEDALLE